VAQTHCERIYLDQAHAKVLQPARFQSSYVRMLALRPRVRMNGLYVLLSSYIKKPVRDMFTEIKAGTILEVRPSVLWVWGGGGADGSIVELD
jgi:hypothetical protein